MIGTRTILHRSAPRLASISFKQPMFVSLRALSLNESNTLAQYNSNSSKKGANDDGVFWAPVIRPFSSPSAAVPPIQGAVSDGVSSKEETIQKTPGSVTKTLRVLNMDVVKNILDELRSVDVNSDGRYEHSY
jgi:hypothetical protein